MMRLQFVKRLTWPQGPRQCRIAYCRRARCHNSEKRHSFRSLELNDNRVGIRLGTLAHQLCHRLDSGTPEQRVERNFDTSFLLDFCHELDCHQRMSPELKKIVEIGRAHV